MAVTPPPLPLGAVPTRTPDRLATAEEGAAARSNRGEGAASVPPGHSDATPALPDNLRHINWEQFMGVRLFAWLGGLALFLAAAFFLKYSFEHGLISPELRIALGFIFGVGLLVGGARLSQRRYKVTADTFLGTGVVILYAVSFAGRELYHLPAFSGVTTFALMVAITVTAFAAAVRLDALVVAVLGMLGGFLTPVLLSTGQDNPLGLFSYIALLDFGLLAVAAARQWHWLTPAGATGTVLIQFGWAVDQFQSSKVWTALAIFLSFCVIYLGAAIGMRKAGRSNRQLIVAALLPPASTFAFTLWLIADPSVGTRPGVLFLFPLGADLAVLALATMHAWPRTEGPDLIAVQAAVSKPAAIWPPLRQLHPMAGVIVFALLAIWTLARLEERLLYWALAGYFAFAVLHTAYPICLRKLNPALDGAPWIPFIPQAGLVLVFLPILKIGDISFSVWLFVLMFNLLALLTAVRAGVLTGIITTLLVNAGLGLIWLLRIPAESGRLGERLTVILSQAALFAGAGLYGGGQILRQQRGSSSPGDEALLPGGLSSAEAQRHIPSLAGVMPFFLLLLVTGQVPLPNPAPVLAAALCLTLLLLALTRATAMSWLPAIALGCTFLVEYAWHERNFFAPAASVAVVWYLGFFVLFAGYPFLFHRGDASQPAVWISSALAGPLHFLLVYDVTRKAWPNEFMGVVPALFALPALAALFQTHRGIPREHPRRNLLLAWFGGVALLFITLIVPIQFERQWLTLAWAFEGAALLWLFLRVPHPGLRHVGIVLLVVAFVRLALNPAVLSYHPRSESSPWNWYLYAYAGVGAACFAGARFMAPPHHLVRGKDARALLVALGTILAFLLLNIEIADYFTAPGERSLVFQFSGNFARDMTYTIGWSLFAFTLVVIGILRRIRPSRWAGIGLLMVTLLKLFFHDLAALDQLYRVGALVGVSAVAIIASFLYQKFLANSGAKAPSAKEPPPGPGSQSQTGFPSGPSDGQ